MKKYALLGNGIGKSLSPQIHSLIYKFFGLNDISYEIIDIPLDTLSSTFKSLKGEYCGFNVTTPFKNTINGLLDKSKSPILPINTIISKNGETVGYNTDIDGFRLSLERNREALLGDFMPFMQKKVETNGYYDKNDKILPKDEKGYALVIGAGGAAEAIIYVLQGMGITPFVKSSKGAHLQRLMDIYKIKDDYFNIKPQLIINCSGKKIDSDEVMRDICLEELRAIYDLNYNIEKTSTALQNKGITYLDGMQMLILQAIHASKILYEIQLNGREEELFSFIYKEMTPYN